MEIKLYGGMVRVHLQVTKKKQAMINPPFLGGVYIAFSFFLITLTPPYKVTIGPWI